MQLTSPRRAAGFRRQVAGERHDVIVVGAGLAGLGAAQALAAAGVDVVVLEARDRIGGRIHTDTTSFPIPIERCAHWLEGNAPSNPLVGLVREAGVQTWISDFDALSIYDETGAKVPAQAVARAWTRFRALKRALRVRGSTVARDESLQQALDAIGWLDGLSAPERTALRSIWFGEVEASYAVDKSALSQLAFWNEEGFPGRSELFTSGAGVLPGRLALGLDVRLEHAVSSIAWDERGARLQTAGGPFVADRVVITVPLGVLKAGAVDFVPPLPPSHQGPIERLGMALLAKLVLQFDEVFWPTRDEFFTLVGERSDEGWYGVNLSVYQPVPLLMLLTGGAAAERIEALGEREAVAVAMAALRRVFPSASDPVRTLMTRQRQDPWQRGSYTFVPVGATHADLAALAEPLGRVLYFAGEHTDPEQYGWAHGAYASGLRAARQILHCAWGAAGVRASEAGR